MQEIVVVTFEIEGIRGGKRDLHEMGMFQLPISGEIIDNRHSSVGGLELSVGRFNFKPDFGSLGAGFSVFPSLGHLQRP